MNWFRVYIDARNDAKLRTLTDAEHRVWFHLLCYAAEQPTRGTIEGVTGVTGVTDVTSALLLAIEVANGDTALLTTTVEKLVNLRVLSIDDDGLSFINFTKRQYDKPSDMPEKTRERKAAQRERERAQNPVNNDGDDGEGVTARDVTPRTEQSREEQNRSYSPDDAPDGASKRPDLTSIDGGKQRLSEHERRFQRFWVAYPKKRSKQDAWKAWQRIKPGDEQTALMIEAIKKLSKSPDWLKEHGQFIPYPATWLNAGGWEDEIAVTATGPKSLDIRDYRPDEWPALAYGPVTTPEERELSRQAAERLMG